MMSSSVPKFVRICRKFDFVYKNPTTSSCPLTLQFEVVSYKRRMQRQQHYVEQKEFPASKAQVSASLLFNEAPIVPACARILEQLIARSNKMGSGASSGKHQEMPNTITFSVGVPAIFTERAPSDAQACLCRKSWDQISSGLFYETPRALFDPLPNALRESVSPVSDLLFSKLAELNPNSRCLSPSFAKKGKEDLRERFLVDLLAVLLLSQKDQKSYLSYAATFGKLYYDNAAVSLVEYIHIGTALVDVLATISTKLPMTGISSDISCSMTQSSGTDVAASSSGGGIGDDVQNSSGVISDNSNESSDRSNVSASVDQLQDAWKCIYSQFFRAIASTMLYQRWRKEQERSRSMSSRRRGGSTGNRPPPKSADIPEPGSFVTTVSRVSSDAAAAASASTTVVVAGGTASPYNSIRSAGSTAPSVVTAVANTNTSSSSFGTTEGVGSGPGQGFQRGSEAAARKNKKTKKSDSHAPGCIPPLLSVAVVSQLPVLLLPTTSRSRSSTNAQADEDNLVKIVQCTYSLPPQIHKQRIRH